MIKYFKEVFAKTTVNDLACVGVVVVMIIMFISALMVGKG